MDNFVSFLKSKYFNFNEEKLKELIETNGINDKNALYNRILLTDFFQIGNKIEELEQINDKKLKSLKGPYVLQIMRSMDASQPSYQQSENSSKRMLQFTLSDGHARVLAIEFEKLNLPNNITRGSKLLVKNCRVIGDMILLEKNNIEYLGGSVQRLVDLEEEKLIAAKRRTKLKPPPFLPLGQSSSSYQSNTPKIDNKTEISIPKQNNPSTNNNQTEKKKITIVKTGENKKSNESQNSQKNEIKIESKISSSSVGNNQNKNISVVSNSENEPKKKISVVRVNKGNSSSTPSNPNTSSPSSSNSDNNKNTSNNTNINPNKIEITKDNNSNKITININKNNTSNSSTSTNINNNNSNQNRTNISVKTPNNVSNNNFNQSQNNVVTVKSNNTEILAQPEQKKKIIVIKKNQQK